MAVRFETDPNPTRLAKIIRFESKKRNLTPNRSWIGGGSKKKIRQSDLNPTLTLLSFRLYPNI